MRFDSYHPAINLFFFAAVIAGTVLFNHPVFLGLSFLCSFAYAAKLRGRRAAWFGLALAPCILLFALFYAGYTHFGVTVLAKNFIGNNLTLESFVYGMVLGTMAASVLLWLSCMNAIFTSDKVVYLFGRVSPRLSLFLSLCLRMVPRLGERARETGAAQRGIGRGLNQGGLFRRIGNFFRMASILVTWTIENRMEAAASMRCRGVTLRGRSALSIYRFDYRDRSLVIAFSGLAAVLLTGFFFDQMRILYNPEIIFNRITPASYIFYLAYGIFCLLPLALQMCGEWRWKRRARQTADEMGA